MLDGVAMVAVHLPMHTATRLAMPVVSRDPPSSPRPADLRLRALRAAEPRPARRRRRHGDARPRGRGRPGRRGAPGARRTARWRHRLPRPFRGWHSRSPIGPGCRRSRPTRSCAGPTAGSPWSAPPRPRAVASTAAGTVRSCRSTTASSASCRSRSYSADVRAQVRAGAEHITFADPDFLNGPAHARRIVEALHAEWPALTYDVTIKVEHLRAHDALLPVLRDTGCAFVTTAVESFDDDGAGAARQGPHPRRRRGGGGALPRSRPGAVADLHRVHAVDVARRLRRGSSTTSSASTWWSTSPRCS